MWNKIEYSKLFNSSLLENRSLLKLKSGEVVIGFFKSSANLWYLEDGGCKQRTISGNDCPIIKYKNLNEI